MTDDKFIWQKRLSEAFSDEENVIGRSILSMQEIDRANQKRITEKYMGYDQTIHAFIEYWFQTLTGFQVLRPASEDKHLLLYLSVLGPCFGRFRQSWEVFLTGHYLDAISMLRAVYQTVIVIAADQTSNFCFREQVEKICSVLGQSEEEKRSKIIHSGFVSLEREANRLVVGDKSELRQSSIESLEKFLRIMHKTVHPLNLHIGLNFKSAIQKQLPLFPEPDEEQLSQYMNNSAFIGWMTMRIITLFNLQDQPFSDDWLKMTKALDGAFKTLVTGFADLGKPIGDYWIDDRAIQFKTWDEITKIIK